MQETDTGEAPDYPWKDPTSKIVVLREDKIDVEEEARLYDQICEDATYNDTAPQLQRRKSSPGPPSIFSRESIILTEDQGTSLAFAQEVKIGGWTSVGDGHGGAYIVYDCAIKSKEGPVIHILKRYSAFEQLHLTLRRTLPRTLLPSLPTLPPKSPLSKFRPAFLDARRRKLEYWLAAVLLHPEVGAVEAVRAWVIN